MQLHSNPKANKFAALAAILISVILLYISVCLYKADLMTLIIFFLFLLFYIQLPGLFILKLLRLDFGRLSTNAIISFFTGWALIVAEYFLSDLIHSDLLLYGLGPILSIVYIAQRWQSRSPRLGERRYLEGVSLAFTVFFVLVLLYALLTTQFTYLSPAESDFTYLNADKAYHMGLIDSLSHDYPLQSPWVQGRTIHYHIFTELLLSVPVRLFGLDSDAMMMSCNPWMTSYVICLSLYSLFTEFCRRKDRAGIYCLLVVLSNLYITRNATSSLAFHFALINDNSVGYGIAGALLLPVLIKRWYEARKESRTSGQNSSRALFALLLIFLMLETGIKGPMAIVILAGIWGTYLLALIMKETKLKDALPLIILSVGFVIVYATILGSKGQSNGNGDSIIAFATIANICYWKPALISFMKSIGLPTIVRLGVVFVVFTIFFLTAYFVPFCAGYVRELILVLRRKKSFDFARISIYAATLVGYIAMFVLNYSGHSQVYFGLVSVFFAPLIAYWFFEDMEEAVADGRCKAIWLKLCAAVFAACIVLTSISLAAFYINHIESAKYSLQPDVEYGKYISISNEEYQAMQWIEDNTPKDALLASDRYYSVPLEDYSYQNRWANRFFLYAVYSNRFCYIEGSGYNLPAGDWVIRKEMLETNAELYDVNNEDRGELARKLGVDYVIVSTRFSELPDLSNDDYSVCYSNSDIIIYKVSQ